MSQSIRFRTAVGSILPISINVLFPVAFADERHIFFEQLLVHNETNRPPSCILSVLTVEISKLYNGAPICLQSAPKSHPTSAYMARNFCDQKSVQ